MATDAGSARGLQAGGGTEPWLFLLGRPPATQYVAFLVQAAPGQNVDQRAAFERWREASRTVSALTEEEAASFEQADELESPAGGLEEIADRYLADPEVASTYAFLPPSVRRVDLDRLLVFQRTVNLRYSAELQEVARRVETDEQLLRYCLGLDVTPPPLASLQASPNSFDFTSPSTDARLLGATLVDASRVGGPVPQGRAVSAVVLYVGYGTNSLSVVRIGRRLVLKNGSHRAHALRALGRRHAWAVLQEVSDPADLAVVPQVQADQATYLQHPRPPLLRDYFDARLTARVDVPRRLHQIRIQFGHEQFVVPASGV